MRLPGATTHVCEKVPRPASLSSISSSASGSMDSTDQIRIKEEIDDSDAATEEEEIPANQNNSRGRKSTNKKLSLMGPIDMKSQEIPSNQNNSRGRKSTNKKL